MWTRKALLLVSLLLCLLVAAPMSCSAATYSLTETEMQTLQDNLNQLEMLNNQQLTALNQSTADCQTLKTQLAASSNQIQTLKTQLKELQSQSNSLISELQQAQALLDSANKSYKQQKNEADREVRSLKVQRFLLTAGMVYFAAK